jgi:3-mercaptopyruvate sulfurtransferase SseA
MLRRVGIKRVRPLGGGIEAWMARDFPLTEVDPDITMIEVEEITSGFE